MRSITRVGARAIFISAGLLWGATSGAATTISAFAASVAPSTPFTISDLTYGADFLAATAHISATATCNADTICDGEAIRYTMSILDVATLTPISAEFAGNASAVTSASFAWSASSAYIVSVTTPFTVGSGPFEQSILSTYLPFGEGGVASAPSLYLTVAPGESITFSLDIFIGAQPVAEPGSVALFGLGLFGMAVNFRFRRKSRGDVPS